MTPLQIKKEYSRLIKAKPTDELVSRWERFNSHENDLDMNDPRYRYMTEKVTLIRGYVFGLLKEESDKVIEEIRERFNNYLMIEL